MKDFIAQAQLLEELQTNQWPALQTIVMNGWLLRFANGYSKRANSITPLYDGGIQQLNEQISLCEQIYEAKQLKPTFRIYPAGVPSHLDQVLEQRGYKLVDRCRVKVRTLTDLAEPRIHTIRLTDTVDEEWLRHYCRLSGTTDEQRDTMNLMFRNLTTKAGFVTLWAEDEPVACGIGVVERGYLGLWDIITSASHRKRGYGEQLLLNLLRWGRDNGASQAFLVVVADNEPACKLYSKVGFQEIYQHWYRVKG